MNIYEKFDKQYNAKELAKEVQEQVQNGGSFASVPYGQYEVSIDKMEMAESKAGDPMVKIWFKVLKGDYKNNLIFYNQVITKSFQIHKVNELLRSMDTGCEIAFESYGQYAQLLLDVHEKIYGNLEYGLKYSEDRKGYSVFEITDVFEVE